MEAERTKVYLGRSLPVPCVQEFVKDHKPTTVPLRYVRSNQDPPFKFNPTSYSSSQIPIIDMYNLLFSQEFKDSELDKLHHACKDWGFFQLINHGVKVSLIENMKSGIEQLFNLPMEKKNNMSIKPGDFNGFGQAFVVSEEQKLDWGDIFAITTLPVYLREPHIFSNLPLSLRDDIEAYGSELKTIAMKLLNLMAKALKMEGFEMKDLFEDGWQVVRMNYYPPCPEPELVMGINNHSDAAGLTILLQVNEMEGLQIKKDGEWIPVKPLPNAFVVNVGDILEIITNGIYRSIEHRATVNSAKERLSVATFYSPSPSLDAELGPASSLVTSKRQALFKRIGIADYYRGFFAKELSGKSYLDVMRIQNDEIDENGLRN